MIACCFLFCLCSLLTFIGHVLNYHNLACSQSHLLSIASFQFCLYLVYTLFYICLLFYSILIYFLMHLRYITNVISVNSLSMILCKIFIMTNYQCLWLARALVCLYLCITKNQYLTVTFTGTYEISRTVPVNFLWRTWCHKLLTSPLSVCISISLKKLVMWTKHIALSADSISPVSCHGKCLFFCWPSNLHVLHILLPGLHQLVRTLCV